MNRRSPGRTFINELMMQALPPGVYVRTFDHLYSSRNDRPRTSLRYRRRIVLGIEIEDDGRAFRIPSVKRVARYIQEGGLEPVIRIMIDKYRYGPVRLRPGDTVIDVDANVGESSIGASRVVDRVLAFEPDPNVYPHLSFNTRAQSNIRCLPIGLGSESGIAVFHLASSTADSSLIPPDRRSVTGVVDVLTLRLDDLWPLLSLSGPVFLKMDAEGAEPEVLLGARNTLGSIDRVAIDCGPERSGRSTTAPVSKLLEASGFQVRVGRPVSTEVVYGWRSSGT